MVDEAVGQLRVYFMKFKVHSVFPLISPTQSVINNIKEECQTANIACTNTLSKSRLLKVLIQSTHLLVEGKC